MISNIHRNLSPQKIKPINWKALLYFNIYRILLSSLFLILFYIEQLPQPLGRLNTNLFALTSIIYLAFSIVSCLFIYRKFPSFNLQIGCHVLVDITALTFLIYFSDGLSSGLGILVIIAVTGGSILMEGKISIFFAAIATITIFGHQLYRQFFNFEQFVNYTHAGILGASFFVTAIIGNLLAARVKETEVLALKQAIEIDELSKLNEHIVQRMQSGTIVIDNNMNVILVNESARNLIERQIGGAKNSVSYFIQTYIKAHLIAWLKHEIVSNVDIKLNENDENEVELQASFIKLVAGEGYQVLIILENLARVRQQAQHIKLASLGRLAASIAHEIRNPLGVISHASQLLREADNLTREDQHLTDIINEHTVRVNKIIENVLSISRREKAILTDIKLQPCLEQFVDEIKLRYSLSDEGIALNKQCDDMIVVKVDPSHLHQVLWNLCENAMRYSRGNPIMTLSYGLIMQSQHPYIDVMDHGSGISEKIKENLFEPFFTTENKGSGLGLYLAKELCEANQVSLNLHSTSEHGTIFRLRFMSPSIHAALV